MNAARPTLEASVTGMVLTPADEQRRVALRRMKLLSLSLLILAAVIYLATLRLDHGGVWGFVNTGAEGAMVGGLADWFAVTALFRHPMGLKIPHTAIVPTRKDEIGRNLQDFFTDNFLTEQIARDRVRAAQVGTRVGRWLLEPGHAHRALGEGLRAGRAGLLRVRDEDVREFVVDGFLPRLAEEPISPIAGDLLDGVIADGAHHGLVDLLAAEVHRWLSDNPQVFTAVLTDRAPWWSPPWLDDRIIGWSYHQAIAWVEDVRTNAAHPTRLALDDLLRTVARDLQTDPDVQARAEALKVRLLTHPQIGETVESLWRSVRASTVSAIDDEGSQLWVRGEALLVELGQKLLDDEPFRTRLEGHLGDLVSFVVNTYGHELAGVITHTIEHWDGQEASERIELHVGRDLQFIRINGTVVGALAGLVIHGVSTLLA